MNELIEKLAQQAFGTAIDTDPILVYEAEKFAELLVKECGKFTDPVTRNLMMKHFGVEE